MAVITFSREAHSGTQDLARLLAQRLGIEFDVEEMAQQLAWMAVMPQEARLAMGRRAAEVVGRWGPDRFAEGTLKALELARRPRTLRSLILQEAR